MKLRNLLQGACLLLLCHAAIADEAQRPVVYDQEHNLLSVHVTDASLKEVLGRIAMKSGVEIQFHPDAERSVSIDFDQRPLERGLENLTHGLNTVLIHDTVEQKPEPVTMLIGMQILPAGVHDTSGLRPLLDPDGEAFIQQKRMARMQEKARPAGALPGIQDYAEQRWLARLERKPPEERQRLLEQAQRKLDKKAARKAEREARRAERKQNEAERRAAEAAAEQAELEEQRLLDPAGFEARQQRQAAAVQQTLDAIAPQLEQ